MICKFKALTGRTKTLDLDFTVGVLLAFSAYRPNWLAAIVYDPVTDTWIELRASPADHHGACIMEAEEITGQQLINAYQFDEAQVQAIRERPEQWAMLYQDEVEQELSRVVMH